ncbi:type IV pilus modification protein PilV [Thiorhodococcus minor]|uniref:Type IV pilus modification protein PilV n=1 Tax=Thiorhodococcus minor TaxID=57489 RepID=A0A6M0K8G1_9GAMM|nr:type IV pilus modification protein PilV [Thiorhodococcus minor]
MREPIAICAIKRQHAFTLLESLVALLVFSAGILGIAAMQVSGMRFTQSAQNLSVGVILAEDMADRMRANLDGTRAGAYDNQCVCKGSCESSAYYSACESISSTCPSDISAVTRNCYGSECTTPSAIMAADMSAWLVAVCQATPPDTLAGVFCTGACGESANRSITVSWVDLEDSTTSSRDFSISFQPSKPKD